MRQCYDQVDTIHEQFQHLFRDSYEEMNTKSVQYLDKWVETVDLMEKNKGNGQGNNPGTSLSEID